MVNAAIFKLYGDIYKDLKKENLKAGDPLIADAIIMASYRQIPLNQLLKIQFLIGKIIKEKKELKAKMEAERDGKNNMGSKENAKSACSVPSGNSTSGIIGTDDNTPIHPRCD